MKKYYLVVDAYLDGDIQPYVVEEGTCEYNRICRVFNYDLGSISYGQLKFNIIFDKQEASRMLIRVSSTSKFKDNFKELFYMLIDDISIQLKVDGENSLLKRISNPDSVVNFINAVNNFSVKHFDKMLDGEPSWKADMTSLNINVIRDYQNGINKILKTLTHGNITEHDDINRMPDIVCPYCHVINADEVFYDIKRPMYSITQPRKIICKCCGKKIDIRTSLFPLYTIDGPAIKPARDGYFSIGLVNSDYNVDSESENCNRTYSNIFDLFTDVDYPSDDCLLEGPSEGVMFNYVATTYLNGLINYMDTFYSIMIRRYTSLEYNVTELSWEKSKDKILNHINNDPLTNISQYANDDVLILAESKDYYWLLWVDRDCSDSCIGKLNKDDYDKDYLIDLLRSTVPLIGNGYKEYIELPEFKGWVTL